METQGHQKRIYKFRFTKDGFWVWALLLPVGMICWALPAVLFIGLHKTDSPEWFAPFMAFIYLGIPSYLVGWIFFYSLMEGLYTKVTITDQKVTLRMPWLLFPLIPVVKDIELDKIQRVNLFAPYGSREAVFLYYAKGRKERHFYLPKFKGNPTYMQEMTAIQKRVEAHLSVLTIENHSTTNISDVKQELLKQRRTNMSMTPHFILRVIRWLYFIILLGIYLISGWITSMRPPGGAEEFVSGFTISFICSLLGFAGMYPIIGQLILWFFGHWTIRAITGLISQMNPDSIYWNTPATVNQILAQLHLQPIHSTLTEFLFWSILIFSMIISVDNTLGWFRRRAYRRYMGL